VPSSRSADATHDLAFAVDVARSSVGVCCRARRIRRIHVNSISGNCQRELAYFRPRRASFRPPAPRYFVSLRPVAIRNTKITTKEIAAVQAARRASYGCCEALQSVHFRFVAVSSLFIKMSDDVIGTTKSGHLSELSTLN